MGDGDPFTASPPPTTPAPAAAATAAAGVRGIRNPGTACFLIAVLQLVARCCVPDIVWRSLEARCCRDPKNMCVFGVWATEAAVSVLSALVQPGNDEPLSMQDHPCIEEWLSSLIRFSSGKYFWYRMECALSYFFALLQSFESKKWCRVSPASYLLTFHLTSLTCVSTPTVRQTIYGGDISSVPQGYGGFIGIVPWKIAMPSLTLMCCSP